MNKFKDFFEKMNLDEATLDGDNVSLYQTSTHGYKKNKYDWGVAYVYHFRDGVYFDKLISEMERLNNIIDANKQLNVSIVPCYDIGTDYIVQSKPPLYGGYHTNMFNEYLHSGSCRPAPWFYKQLAFLYESVDKLLDELGDSDRELIHAQLIKPNNSLFWADEEGWRLYLPDIKF